MTWASITTDGRGEVAFRLEIERLETQFVTHQFLASSTRLALLRVGGVLRASSNPVTGELDVGGLSALIVDHANAATALFATQPDFTTWLTSSLTAAEVTTINVRSTAGWPSAGDVWIDSEVIAYTGKTATTFTGLTRGEMGSLAQAHYVDAGGTLRYPEVSSSLPSLAGCRARLYAYGHGDDPQGDGTQIWLGVVTRHPSLSGAAWTLPIDPITSVLEGSVSSDLDEPSKPRGIKYQPRGLLLAFERQDTGDRISVAFPEDTDADFFETNDLFVATLTVKITAAITAAGWGVAFGCRIRAIADGDATWYLGVATDTTVFVHAVRFSSFVDPVFDGAPTTLAGDVAVPASGVEDYWLAAAGSPEAAGSVPRGVIMRAGDYGGTLESTRIYVSGAAVSSYTTSVVIGSGDEAITASILSTNTATNSILLDDDGIAMRPRVGPIVYWTAADLPDVRLTRVYTASGSLYGALVQIILSNPDLLNRGAVPDLRAGDLDGAAWGALDLSTQPRVVRSRRYESGGEVPLGELVRADLLLAGYSLGVNATGQITIAPISSVANTSYPALAIDGLLDVPSWEPTAYGLVNQIKIMRGYLPADDEYTGGSVTVRSVADFGRNPRPRTVTISPKSTTASGELETYAECVSIAQRILSAYGGTYAIITAIVPLLAFTTATLGAVVSLTSPHLPDTDTGTMGVAGLRCIVTGREVDLSRGRVKLRLYASTGRVGGYVPAAIADTATVVSGDIWDLTLSADYLPVGTDADNWWAVGDLVAARIWNSTANTSILGTVTAVAALVVRVSFATSAAALAADTWYLTSQASSVALSTTQRRYAFVGDTAGMVTFDSGDEPARRFG